MKPQRIQLSRKKGFDLQAVSMALNGLPAVNCARPSLFGNPFKLGTYSPADCVGMFKEWINGEWTGVEFERFIQASRKLYTLKGKNLACYCDFDQPCHCDVLLEIVKHI